MVQESPLRLALSEALENYLKTIYRRMRESSVVRVRDIAHDLDVKAPSVTAALKRLAGLGLVRYVQREYVQLTPAGEEQARRVDSRDQVLRWFFEEVLFLPRAEAAANACSMEHFLTPGAMDRFVRLFEFVQTCPDGQTLLGRYENCPLVNKEVATCGKTCLIHGKAAKRKEERTLQLAEIRPGHSGKVVRVDGDGELRQRLIEMGLLPDQVLTVERTGPRGDPLWIRLAGFQLALRRAEARLVIVSALGSAVGP